MDTSSSSSPSSSSLTTATTTAAAAAAAVAISNSHISKNGSGSDMPALVYGGSEFPLNVAANLNQNAAGHAVVVCSANLPIHNELPRTFLGHSQPQHSSIHKANSKKSSPRGPTVDKPAAPTGGCPYFTPQQSCVLPKPTRQIGTQDSLAVDAFYRISAANEQPLDIKWTYTQDQIHSLSANVEEAAAATAYAQSPMSATAAAAAATAAAFSKFDQQASSTPAMTNLAISGSGWPIGAGTDWELQAGLGKSDVYSLQLPSKQLNGFADLDPRVINMPSYYNVSAGSYGSYASKAACLASYPQMQYMRDSSTAAAAVAAAAAPFNFNLSTAAGTYGYGNCACPSNFVDYCNLNYYGNGVTAASFAAVAAAAALNPPVLMSGQNSPSGNSAATANVADDFKNLHGLNEEFFTTQESGLPVSNASPQKNGSSINGCNAKQTTKQKKSKKKKAVNGGKPADGVLASTANGRANSVNRMTPEPSSTHAFIWELDDLCSINGISDTFMLQLVDQIVRCSFHVEPIDELNELNQVNVEDTEIDDTLPEHNDIYQNVIHVNNMKSADDTWGGNKSVNQVTSSAVEMMVNDHQTTSTAGLIAYPEQPQSTSTGVGFLPNGVPRTSSNDSTHAANGANMINREVLEGLRRIAAKYRNVRATYNTYMNDITGFLDFCGLSAQKEEILTRLNGYDKMAGRPLERYKRCLRLIVERSRLMKEKSTNIIITQEPLVRSIVKVLILGLGSLIPIENIYSIQRIGRDVVFSRITDRFKKQYAVTISSNVDIRSFSRQQGINCWFVNSLDDVDKLYLALDTLILFDPTSVTVAENKQNGHPKVLSPADVNTQIYVAENS